MKLFGRNVHTDVNIVKVRARADGTAEDPCWFCGGAVIVPSEGQASDAAIIMIDPVDGHGARTQGVCHATCAERARGSLRL
jgi:hypothetical protein